MKTSTFSLLLASSLLLAACGFHMRSNDSVGLPADSIFLDTSGGGHTGRNVEQQLKLTDVKLAESPKTADYIVSINNERFDREVLSVSPRTGKVEEYELIISVYLSVATGEGEALIQNDLLSTSRDYVFDQDAVISSGDEEKLIREELTRLIADQALLRARVVIDNHQSGTEPDSADQAASR